MKKTLVLGATTNPARFSNIAVKRLLSEGYETVPLGVRDGEIAGVKILKGEPALEEVDTITLYLNPVRQRQYYDYILRLQPKRLIFNPGTENPELAKLAKENGIEVEVNCTLVMLSLDTY